MHEEDSGLTLEALAVALGKPEPGLVEAYTAGEVAELVEQGSKIASSRVLTDVERIYGTAHAFWRGATSEQKQALIGFSPELLAVAVDRALALAKLAEESGDGASEDAAAKKAREARAQQAFSRGITLRDHARTALRTVAGPAAAARKEVDDAAGTAETPASLGRGLGALAALTRKLIAHKRDAIAARAKAARLSEDYAKQLEAAAEEVLAADQAASAPRTAARINQGNLDRADGVNLHLLGEIIHTFDAAHELDPSVPRLVPIATRRLLGSDKRKKAAAPTAPPEPAVL